VRCARRTAGGATPLIFCLDPESPIHPCVHTQPEDGVLTGDFEEWDCSVSGNEVLGDRATTIWRLGAVHGSPIASSENALAARNGTPDDGHERCHT